MVLLIGVYQCGLEYLAKPSIKNTGIEPCETGVFWRSGKDFVTGFRNSENMDSWLIMGV